MEHSIERKILRYTLDEEGKRKYLADCCDFFGYFIIDEKRKIVHISQNAKRECNLEKGKYAIDTIKDMYDFFDSLLFYYQHSHYKFCRHCMPFLPWHLETYYD